MSIVMLPKDLREDTRKMAEAKQAAGAEAVLKLRALISNGDFDAYWTFHLRAEHQRIHQARYQPQHRLAA